MSELVDGALIDVSDDITLDDMYRMYGDDYSKDIIDILWKGVLKIREGGGIDNPDEYKICDDVYNELEAKGFVEWHPREAQAEMEKE